MPHKLSLFLLTLLPISAMAQSESTFEQKAAYNEVLYLQSIYYNSKNPTSISRAALQNVTDIKVQYLRQNGDFRAIDAPATWNEWNCNMYGIKKFNKIAFEGSFEYHNIAQKDKRWNSTLFLNKDNPFIISDSLSGDYTTETFRLNGGFSYEITPKWHAGMRAVYNAGSSADQSDPRPDIKGMRFSLNPGTDYALGEFVIGLSGKIGWLSESLDYTAVKTYENYQLFLFHGLGDPDTKTAIGYERKYTGTSYEGNLQLAWNHQNLKNFFEIGLQKVAEKAEDGGISQRFKGGKYESTTFSLTERFSIRHQRMIHNITLNGALHKINGTWYQQKQTSTSDGNTVWEVTGSSICHKNNYSDFTLEYRLDFLNSVEIPYLTFELKGGMHQTKVNHYPEGYLQKYNSAYGEANITKRLSLKKFKLTIDANALYNRCLNDKNEVGGSKLEFDYNTPAFQYSSAGFMKAGAKVTGQYPLILQKFKSWIGCFIAYSYTGYDGKADYLNKTSRQEINAGINLIF